MTSTPWPMRFTVAHASAAVPAYPPDGPSTLCARPARPTHLGVTSRMLQRGSHQRPQPVPWDLQRYKLNKVMRRTGTDGRLFASSANPFAQMMSVCSSHHVVPGRRFYSM